VKVLEAKVDAASRAALGESTAVETALRDQIDMLTKEAATARQTIDKLEHSVGDGIAVSSWQRQLD
jgi:hypothetical protein